MTLDVGARTQNVFIVSSGRSGSTLLRVMLAGHSGLFAPPELNLLAFADVGEMVRTLGPCPTLACAALGCDMLDGLRRAIMEALQVDAEESSDVLNGWARERRPTVDVYRTLCDAIRPRTMVDKSPLYALRADILPRAEAWFDEPRYVHLVRHPKASILSRARDNAAGTLLRWATGGAARETEAIDQAEVLWRLMTRNVIAFLASVPAERKLSVRFEDLVRSPESTMARLSDFLAVPHEESLLNPYEGNRMRDGVRKGAIAGGSREIHKFSAIDSTQADDWSRERVDWHLADDTAQLASAIGYDL